MKTFISSILFSCLILCLGACFKENTSLSLEQIKYNNNKSTYPSTQMDSAQVIKSITRQKVQEVLDLSILYVSGNQDTEIDSAMLSQVLGYFHKPDSSTLKRLFREIDSLKVKSIKIENFEVFERYHKNDTLNFARFNLKYKGKHNKPIEDVQREAQYILVPAPIKFKKEFKFYFLNFYQPPLKDSTASGITK